ncbi:hypothetical protein [Gordonia terrae]|uniref:hypothetical protein n=1 Tax=Gordonia terrae TaxID=2055 RepID=UPI001267D058|nr:hypothetical protein [Gordonia terrae]
MTGRSTPGGAPWPRHAARGGAPGWWTRVTFASGWGFCDPDPTPKLRADREAAEIAARELHDARQRREQRRRDNAAATAAIRAAMSSARGGVA